MVAKLAVGLARQGLAPENGHLSVQWVLGSDTPIAELEVLPSDVGRVANALRDLVVATV